MKTAIAIIGLLGFSFILGAADPPAAVTYMDAAKVAGALAKTGLIVNNSEFMVAGAHREKPGQVELHEKTTDILFVVEGEALNPFRTRTATHRLLSPGLQDFTILST